MKDHWFPRQWLRRRGTDAEPDTAYGPRPSASSAAADGDRPTAPERIEIGGHPQDHRDDQQVHTAVLLGTSGGAWAAGTRTIGNHRVAVRAGTVRGFSDHDGQSQDAGVVAVGPAGVAVGIFDGVGGVPGSERAARKAATVVADVFPQMSADVSGSVHVLDLAQTICASLAPEDGATTMALVVVGETDGTPHVHVGLVGDSPAIRIAGGHWEIARDPHLPEDGTTRWAPRHQLTGDDVFSAPLEVGTPVLVATDGLTDSVGGGTTTLGQHIIASWQTPPRPLNFLADLDFRIPGHIDDRTAAGIWLLP